jgi:hypothetical protein
MKSQTDTFTSHYHITYLCFEPHSGTTHWNAASQMASYSLYIPPLLLRPMGPSALYWDTLTQSTQDCESLMSLPTWTISENMKSLGYPKRHYRSIVVTEFGTSWGETFLSVLTHSFNIIKYIFWVERMLKQC